jgi:hypothetical protein
MLKNIRNMTLVGYVYKNESINFVPVWDVGRYFLPASTQFTTTLIP